MPPSAAASTAPALSDGDRLDCARSSCTVGVLTPRAKAALEAQPDFKDLRLTLRDGEGDAALRALTLVPWLKRLTIVGLPAVHDLGPLSFLVALQSLSLSRLPNVRTLAPLRTLAHLEELDVLALPALADPDASALAALRSLRKLALDVPPAMHDLGALATLPSLQVLTLSGHVGDLSTLAPSPALVRLTVSPDVPDAALEPLRRARPALDIRRAAAP